MFPIDKAVQKAVDEAKRSSNISANKYDKIPKINIIIITNATDPVTHRYLVRTHKAPEQMPEPGKRYATLHACSKASNGAFHCEVFLSARVSVGNNLKSRQRLQQIANLATKEMVP